MGDLRERGHFENIGVEGDNIKMDFQEAGWGCMDWIDLTQDIDRRSYAVMNLRIP